MKQAVSLGVIVAGAIILVCSSEKCRNFITSKFQGQPPAATQTAGTDTQPEAPPPAPTTPIQVPTATGSRTLNVCTFNIQFLGNPKDRDNDSLARAVADCDLVVIQELVAPPCDGTFPDGTPYRPDPEAAEFFKAMAKLGFSYVLSEEDTGSGDKIHLNSSSTEWWVVFYKPDAVGPANDLPRGFLAADRSNNPDYERVPYAFPFRTTDGKCDFVLISVHLQPDSGPAARARRKHELASIARWIDYNDEVEKDFIVLGDMNIENAKELASATPPGFLSLNNECRATNTKGDKPYDHIMFNPTHTSEIDNTFDCRVVDLVSLMHQFWNRPGQYPGMPYDHNNFRRHYSDHHPVVFRMSTPGMDDDFRRVATRPVETSN